MTGYTAPLGDIRFALNELAGLPAIAALPAFQDTSPDLVENILEEAAKIAAGVLAPLNRKGDRDGARLTESGVRTTPGWRDAWTRFPRTSLSRQASFAARRIKWHSVSHPVPSPTQSSLRLCGQLFAYFIARADLRAGLRCWHTCKPSYLYPFAADRRTRG
ncbi:hypothetical protein ACWGS9_18365 [Bradyrhizobium sp. Arg314]